MSFIRELFPPRPHHSSTDTRPLTNELLPSLKDAIFAHHLTTPSFSALTPESIFLAEIAPTHHKCATVLSAAHKAGLIDSATGRPDTTKVGKNMVHDMPVLGGISKQREFVMLLFFWEEEIRRWEGFEEEERMVVADGGDDVQEKLRVLRARKRVVPSLREVVEEGLPRYEETARA